MKNLENGLMIKLDGDKDSLYNKIIKENIDDRKIVINDDISTEIIENVVLYIFKFNKEDKDIPITDRKRIIIYINTDGGDVIEGNMLLFAITSSLTPIVTVGLSCCASMGSYILASGHERIAFNNTVVLIHDGQTGYCSSGNKGKDIQKFYDDLDKLTCDFMIEHTKMSKDYLESIKDREYYMFAKEAKEKGIIDKIVGVDCDLTYIL